MSKQNMEYDPSGYMRLERAGESGKKFQTEIQNVSLEIQKLLINYFNFNSNLANQVCTILMKDSQLTNYNKEMLVIVINFIFMKIDLIPENLNDETLYEPAILLKVRGVDANIKNNTFKSDKLKGDFIRYYMLVKNIFQPYEDINGDISL